LAYKGLSLGELGFLQEALKYFKKALSIDNEYDLAIISKERTTELLKFQRNLKSKK
jgi:tetratricopeptide (TPR) repeat protein